MNQYRKREDGTVTTEEGFRSSFPEVAFPPVLDAATLDAYGYDPLLQSPQLVPGYGQVVVADQPWQDSSGNWFLGWKIIDIDPEAQAFIKAQDQANVDAMIKAERDRRKAGGVKLTIEGKDYWFWTDDPSRNQYAMLDSKVRRSGIPPDSDYKLDDWKTMSGEYVVFTVKLLYQVIDAGIAGESALFKVAEQKRQALLTVANPNTFQWNSDWPQTYEEYAAAKAAADAAAAAANKPSEDQPAT